MVEKLVSRETLIVETCCTCGVRHAFPETLWKQAQNDHDNKVYCPNGHWWHYTGETEAEKLRLERDRLKQNMAWKEDQLRQEKSLREGAERAASAYKGHSTRLRNRAVAGVCPCCQRSFENLRRHMKTKHPKFAEQSKEWANV